MTRGSTSAVPPGPQTVRSDGLTTVSPSLKSWRAASSAVVNRPPAGSCNAFFGKATTPSSANHRRTVRRSSSPNWAADRKYWTIESEVAMSSNKSFALLASACALALASCGGGGGGGGGGSPINSTPPPPPPPPSANYVKIFPNVTTSTEFATLGYEASGNTTKGDDFAVRYDAAQQVYIIDTPYFAPGKFDATSQDASSWTSDSFATILKPNPANPASPYKYTTSARYYGCPMGCSDLGVFAFGTATASSAVPTSGSATYQADAVGLALDSNLRVGGTASLQFNFGAGTLAGTFNPILLVEGGPINLGQYSFVDSVFGVGSATFAGKLEHTSFDGLGSFNGHFTGPAAEELLGRWKAPYVNPINNNSSEIFGVWIGRKP